MRERWEGKLDADPYYNPHFSRGFGDFNLRADLLRPEILRPNVERSQEDSRTKSPLTTSPEDFRAFIEAQQRAARDSDTNALIPASEDGGVRNALLKSLEHYEGSGL
jgi:hypothetical protein